MAARQSKASGRPRASAKASATARGKQNVTKAERLAAARASAGGDKAAQKRAAEQREAKSHKVGTKAASPLLRGRRIDAASSAADAPGTEIVRTGG